MRYPNLLFQELRHNGYKLKGVGEITCHPGRDFFRDPNGTLTWGAKTYAKHIVNQFEAIFGSWERSFLSFYQVSYIYSCICVAVLQRSFKVV
jgi:hypothetical protein